MDELECVKKLMQITAVRNTKETLTNFYSNTKSRNEFIHICCSSAEKTWIFIYNGSYPILRVFGGPIKMADSVACVLLDKAQENLPPLLEFPINTLSTGCQRLINSSFVQFALSTADSALNIVEKTVSFVIIPVQTTGDDIDKNCDKRHFSESIKSIYNVATLPIQITGKVVCASRNTIKQFQNKPSIEINIIPPDEDKKKHHNFLAHIAHLPLRALHFIGMLAEKRSILRRQTSCELTDLSLESCQKEMESVDRMWKVLDDLDADYNNEVKEAIVETESNEDYANENVMTEPINDDVQVASTDPIPKTQVKKQGTKVVKSVKPLDKNKPKPNAQEKSKPQRKIAITQTRAPLMIESSRKMVETRKTRTTSK